MKRLLFATLLLSSPIFADKTNWSSVSSEEKEIAIIMREIARIKETFTAHGAGRSSAFHNTIFEYLKKIGTPTAFKVLKSLIDRGELPKSYLYLA